MVLLRNMFLMVCSFPCVAIEYRSRTTANSNVALLLENSPSYNEGVFNATDES